MARPLGERVLVSGQIQPEDVPGFPAQGVATIVNNRPDGEEAGQPTGAEVEEAARAAGLDYVHIPISDGFSDDKIAAMDAALANSDGAILVYCKSGTRSAFLWALARARQGADAEELVSLADQAGYDLRQILPWLQRR